MPHNVFGKVLSDVPLTSGITKSSVLSFPAVWTSSGVFLMFIQTGFAVDPPTTLHLVWTAGHKKADLTHQFVWWCVHKLIVIPTRVGSIGSHLLHMRVGNNM